MNGLKFCYVYFFRPVFKDLALSFSIYLLKVMMTLTNIRNYCQLCY